jgi:hypothetical protein
MSTTITLDETRFRVVTEKARALGTTPEQYLQGLIDADSRSFDDMLAPVRQGFASTTDEEADELFDRARKASRKSE